MLVYTVAGAEHWACKMGRGEEVPSETQKWVNSLRIKFRCSTRAEHSGKYSARTVLH